MGKQPPIGLKETQSLVGTYEDYRPAEEGFGLAFIDADESRETPRRLRYVHGGFKDTHTRFSFYFPPPEQYKGRFFQYLEGGAGGHENLLAAGWQPGIALDWVFGLTIDELGGYVGDF